MSADEGGGGVRQMLMLADEGGGGSLASLRKQIYVTQFQAGRNFFCLNYLIMMYIHVCAKLIMLPQYMKEYITFFFKIVKFRKLLMTGGEVHKTE